MPKSNLDAMFEADVPTQEAVDTVHIDKISDIARDQVSKKEELSQLEDDVKRVKKEYIQISQVDLPEAMQSVGMASFTLDNGSSISVKDQMRASLPKKNRVEVANWLKDHGAGSLIKDTVVVEFQKGENSRAEELINLLVENGFSNFHEDISINTGSLKSLAKEKLAQGEDIPLELMGIFLYQESIIK
jgi:hypothetical protein